MALVRLTNLNRRSDAPWECRRRERLALPPERVWRALTDPSELAAWWCDRAEGEVRTGGEIAWLGSTCPRLSSAEEPGTSAPQIAEVLVAEPPWRLELRWRLDGGSTRVVFELESHLEQTELLVTQSADSQIGWPGSDGDRNWWSVALPALRAYVEEGAARLRLDYAKASLDAPLEFRVPVSTFPWIVWSKLTETASLRGWWSREARIDARVGGQLELGAAAHQPCRIRELRDDGPSLLLSHDWRWTDDDVTTISWTIDETDDDTLIGVRDDSRARDPNERLRRALHWASLLLDLQQMSARGTAPLEYAHE